MHFDMKKLVIFIGLIFPLVGATQGVQPMSDKEYAKLPTPPILVGAGDLEPQHIIPDAYFPLPGDQGDNWSCAGWAIGYYLHSYYEGMLTTTPPKIDPRVFSHSYLYDILRRCKNKGCTCGIQISDALEYLQNNGNVPLKNYPGDCDNPQKDATLKAIATNYKIKNWKSTQTSNLNDLKSYVLDDIPVIVCIGIDQTFKDFKHKTEQDTYDMTEPFDQYDYHCVLITGYDENRKAFRIINSYGTNWGVKGFGWISYKAFNIMFSLGKDQAFIIKRDFEAPAAGGANVALINVQQNNTVVNSATIRVVAPIGNAPYTVSPNILNVAIQKNNDNTAQKDTTLSKTRNVKLPGDTMAITYAQRLKSVSFHPYVYMETIAKDNYYITTGFKIDDSVKSKVLNISYFYDDPSFIHKNSISYKRPNFESRYKGYGCLVQMSATIHFIDGSSMPVTVHPCKLIDSPEVIRNFPDKVANITPVVTAKIIDKGTYHSQIRLSGIEDLKDDITEVVYDRNDPTFKQRFQVVKNKASSFASEYRGWGCLDHLLITIHFKDNSTKQIDFSMCKQLGWE